MGSAESAVLGVAIEEEARVAQEGVVVIRRVLHSGLRLKFQPTGVLIRPDTLLRLVDLLRGPRIQPSRFEWVEG